jgi:hypothetical protein
MHWVDAILQGRTIRWFLGVVALYLAYQVWLNGRYFGNDWACWDYMLISGFLAFLVAIWLATSITRRLDEAIERLRLNNALIIDAGGVARLKAHMAAQGKSVQVWSGILIGLIVFGSFVWVFAPYVGPIWTAWRAGTLPEGGVALLELSIFTLISALCAALAGLFFGRLTHYGTLASVLSADGSGLRIVPGHQDGAAGLKPIGDFYLYQALLLAIPILWLGLWWAWIIPNYKDVVCPLTGQPQMLFREWQGPYFVQWLVVLLYFQFAFVRPVLTLRRYIRARRTDLNRGEAPRLESELLDRQRQLLAHSPVALADAAGGLDQISRRLWAIRSMGEWPMDVATLAKYRSVVVGEVLLPLAGAAISTAQPGGSSSAALLWLRSWLGLP